MNFDDLSGRFGNPTLDRAVTSPVWKDRLLGGHREVELPVRITWYASGNNVDVGSAMVRRICHVRLTSPVENPEERTDIARPKLLPWLRSERLRDLRAALLVLRGYHTAGRPAQNLPPWLGFEDWSDLVRSAVVWAGLADPGATREGLRETAAKDDSLMATVLECLQVIYPAGDTFLRTSSTNACGSGPAAARATPLKTNARTHWRGCSIARTRIRSARCSANTARLSSTAAASSSPANTGGPPAGRWNPCDFARGMLFLRKNSPKPAGAGNDSHTLTSSHLGCECGEGV